MRCLPVSSHQHQHQLDNADPSERMAYEHAKNNTFIYPKISSQSNSRQGASGANFHQPSLISETPISSTKRRRNPPKIPPLPPRKSNLVTEHERPPTPISRKSLFSLNRVSAPALHYTAFEQGSRNHDIQPHPWRERAIFASGNQRVTIIACSYLSESF